MTAAPVKDRAILLAEFTRENRERPFEWGRWDCNLFCLAWLKALNGDTHFDLFAGEYDSQASARAWLREHPLTLRSVLEASGCQLVEGGRNFAQHGDFLLVDDPTEPWYRGHVCGGSSFISIWPGATGGFRIYPMSKLPFQTTVLRLPCPR